MEYRVTFSVGTSTVFLNMYDTNLFQYELKCSQNIEVEYLQF